MLDPDILREKPQEVRRMLEKRSVEFDIDGLLAANEARLKDMASCDAIRHERNKIGKMISEAKKSNKDPADSVSCSWTSLLENQHCLVLMIRKLP